MNHSELHSALRAAGWTAQSKTMSILASGPCDRAIQTIPERPEHALCVTLGEGRAECGLEAALAWGLECLPR